MKLSSTVFLFLLAPLVLSSCAVAPQTMPMDAHALGAGNTAFAIDAVPTQSLRARRGFGERVDIGVQFEPVLLTGFAKLSVYQTPSLAAALYVAGTKNGGNHYSGNSIQVGPMLSYSRNRFDIGWSMRYSKVNYEPAQEGDFGTDQQGIKVFDDALSEYYSADLMVGIRLGSSPARLKLGVTCTSYTLNPPGRGVQGCVPVLGLMLNH